MHLTATGNALFTKTQQRVLGMLFGEPDRRFYTNEIVRLANMGRGTVTRELDRLQSIGLINSFREGNQRYFQVNQHCPIYPEVLSIVRKTSGIDGIILNALQPWHERIQVAFVYGVIANGKENVDSPVDLFIIADGLAYGDVMLSLNDAAVTAGRAINPSIYSQRQIRRELAKNNAFINRVMRHPKLWVLGKESRLREIRQSVRQIA
ncbi:MAG: winged helix-turn-helix domain-containing protein [Gammaproteobacteria bacterium]|nr:winged helix-turn-helix domain-containing protein [Gammaproteobacteria bacterium]